MSTALKPAPEERSEIDLFRYGWRYVWKAGPNGQEKRVRIPLTQADVLHPQEDDFIVQNPAHEEDCHFLKTVLTAHLAGQAGVEIYRDLRIDWGVVGHKPLGPDLAVLANVPDELPRQMGTLEVKTTGARPLLVLEVTSPTTRDLDLDEKVVEYDLAGVPFYAIVDRRVRNEREELRLLAYRATDQGYVRVKLDDQGWLALETIGLWLRIEDHHLVCHDEHGQRLLNYQEIVQDYRAEVRAREKAEVRAEVEARARQEAEARTKAAEERIRQLEAELNRLRGQP